MGQYSDTWELRFIFDEGNILVTSITIQTTMKPPYYEQYKNREFLKRLEKAVDFAREWPTAFEWKQVE